MMQKMVVFGGSFAVDQIRWFVDQLEFFFYLCGNICVFICDVIKKSIIPNKIYIDIKTTD